MTTLVLVSVLGACGYLIVGWAATIICAASMPTRVSGDARASVAWWWNLVAWPVILPFLGIGWLALHGGERVSNLSLRLVRRMNPEIGRWY